MGAMGGGLGEPWDSIDEPSEDELDEVISVSSGEDVPEVISIASSESDEEYGAQGSGQNALT
eukprot:4618059-Karenia_brevis.AAC.1